jgi:hypothetical protein
MFTQPRNLETILNSENFSHTPKGLKILAQGNALGNVNNREYI